MKKQKYEKYKISIDLSEIETLDDLFKEWKKSHKEEHQSSMDLTIPVNKKDERIDKESFTPDGYIDKDKYYENANIKVLYILKESNISSNACNGKCKESPNFFWFKHIVDSGETNNDYYKKIRAIHSIITENPNPDLCKIAYMNVNKRGGFGSCDIKKLANYASVYSCFIKRQIELLKPKVIVVLGPYDILYEATDAFGCKEMLAENKVKTLSFNDKNVSFRHANFKKDNCDTVVTAIYMYHPAAVGYQNEDKYKSLFCEIWKKSKDEANSDLI